MANWRERHLIGKEWGREGGSFEIQKLAYKIIHVKAKAVLTLYHNRDISDFFAPSHSCTRPTMFYGNRTHFN